MGKKMAIKASEKIASKGEKEKKKKGSQHDNKNSSWTESEKHEGSGDRGAVLFLNKHLLIIQEPFKVHAHHTPRGGSSLPHREFNQESSILVI